MNTIKAQLTKLVCNLVGLIFLFSCNSPSQSGESFQNELFKIRFKSKPLLLAHSNVYNGSFVLNNIDTFYYDVGFNVSNLSEKCMEVIYTKDSVELSNRSDGVIYVSDKYYDVDRTRKRNIEYFMRQNIMVKLVYPIDTILGNIVGIYVDSLLDTKLGKVKMNLFSPKLKRTSYQEITEALRKIEFFKWDTSKIEIPYGTYYIN